MWYELDNGNKLIKKQCDTLLDCYTSTEIIDDKELINIDDMWEMIEKLCYKLEEVQEKYHDMSDTLKYLEEQGYLEEVQ